MDHMHDDPSASQTQYKVLTHTHVTRGIPSCCVTQQEVLHFARDISGRINSGTCDSQRFRAKTHIKANCIVEW